MPETRREDPFAAIALLSEQSLELRSPEGLTVPLYFEPDAAYIMRALLLSNDDITTGNISREHGFRSAAPDPAGGTSFGYEAQMTQHARIVVSHMVFTFNALGSTLIHVEQDGVATVRGRNRARQTRSHVYSRNPEYAVLDDRP